MTIPGTVRGTAPPGSPVFLRAPVSGVIFPPFFTESLAICVSSMRNVLPIFLLLLIVPSHQDRQVKTSRAWTRAGEAVFCVCLSQRAQQSSSQPLGASPETFLTCLLTNPHCGSLGSAAGHAAVRTDGQTRPSPPSVGGDAPRTGTRFKPNPGGELEPGKT